MPKEQIMDSFNKFGDNKESVDIKNYCYIRNTNDQFRKYWAVVKGNELFCYKEKGAEKFEVMHSLANTFIETAKPFQAPDLQITLYPIKIVLAKTKLRILYFDEVSVQEEWVAALKKSMDQKDVFQFYKVIDELGKGQFGVVKLAQHIVSGKKVAIKTVKKEKMSPIEVTQ